MPSNWYGTVDHQCSSSKPGVSIGPVEMQDLLDSVISMTTDAVPGSTPMIGDVLEIIKHKVELVQMALPKPRAGGKPMQDKGKLVNLETNDRSAVNSSSIMHHEDWDLVDNNIFLAKIQLKL